MSGCSFSNTCPVCGLDLNVYTDSKPVDSVSLFCGHCGFQGSTCFTLLSEEERAGDCDDYSEEFVPLTVQERRGFLKDFEETFGPLAPAVRAAYLGRPKPKQRVRISVRGGVVYVDACPKDVAVIITDHDNLAAGKARRGH